MNFAIGGAAGIGCYAASNGYNNRLITQLFGKVCSIQSAQAHQLALPGVL